MRANAPLLTGPVTTPHTSPDAQPAAARRATLVNSVLPEREAALAAAEAGIAADAFEKERDEVGGSFLGERGIHGGEFPHVVGSE